MRITLDLNHEDVRRLIENKIHTEASKHGHASDTSQVVWISHHHNGVKVPLENLCVHVHAEIEVK